MTRIHPPTTKHMKHHRSPRGGRMLFLGTLCLGGIAFAQQEEAPHGKLSVDNTLVRVGAQSQLQWQIRYNVTVDTLIELLKPQTPAAKEEINVRVRVIGSGDATVKTNHGHGNNIDGVDSSNPGQGVGGPTGKKNSGEDPSGTVDDEKKTGNSTAGTDMPVEVLGSINRSGWTRLFYGLQSSVVPTDVVLDTTLQPGDTIDIASRGFGTEWLPLYGTDTNNKNVMLLKNGDPVPKQIALKQYGQIASFLKPYLSTDGKTVKIGDRDLLVLFELDNSNPNASGYDYQDIGVLITLD